VGGPLLFLNLSGGPCRKSVVPTNVCHNIKSNIIRKGGSEKRRPEGRSKLKIVCEVPRYKKERASGRLPDKKRTRGWES